MADCRLCGKRLPFLHYGESHKQCLDAYVYGQRTIAEWTYECVMGTAPSVRQYPAQLIAFIETLARRSRVPIREISGYILQGWKRAFDEMTAENRLPGQHELDHLSLCAKALNLSPAQLDWAGVRERMLAVKSEELMRDHMVDIIEAIQRGVYLPYPGDASRLPCLWQKDETLLWIYENVAFWEEKVIREVRHESVGFYDHGLSAHQGKSYSIEHEKLFHQGDGHVAMTSKHLYFTGRKTHRIAYDSIAGLKTFRDAMEIYVGSSAPKRHVYFGLNGVYAGAALKALARAA